MVKKKSLLKMGCWLLVCAISMASLSGCGKDKNADQTAVSGSAGSSVSGSSGIVSDFLGKTYGTEYYDLASTGSDSYLQVYGLYQGKLLYGITEYSGEKENNTYFLFDLVSKTSEEFSLDVSENDDENNYLSNVVASNSGKLALLYNNSEYSENGDYTSSYSFRLYNTDGSYQTSLDMSDIIKDYSENDQYIYRYLYLDNGSLAVILGSDIVFVDENGEIKGKTNVSLDYVNTMSINNEGKIVLTGYGMQGMEAVLVNPDTYSTEGKYENVPYFYNSAPAYTSDGMLIVPADSNIALYDPNSKKTDNIANYIDCEIIGNNIGSIFVTEENQIVLYLHDYETNTNELVYLTEIDPANVVEKEIITLGTLYAEASNLEKAVVNFNKKSDKYKIKITEYADINNLQSEEDYLSVLSAMNSAFLSDDCPDIIDLTYANRENLVNKNILLDLNEFFDYTSKYRKDDYFSNVLDAYTINGVLTSIPKTMNLNLVIGGQSLLEDYKDGWTLQDFMDICKEYPNAQPFEYATKEQMLYSMLSENSKMFLDYTNGTCDFDNEEFKDILSFCNLFPDDFDYASYEGVTSDDYMKHNVLFANTYVSSVEDILLYKAMLGEPVYLMGYPDQSGKNEVCFAADATYGVSAKTQHKEAIFEFLETLLEEEITEYSYVNGMSARKSIFEQQCEKAMKEEYIYDENGEIMTDEKGEYLKTPKITYGIGDETFELYAASQEEIDMLKDAMSRANKVIESDYTLYNMIFEEAQPYFKGQKSIDETVKVIQSRMSMYISEQY